MSPAPPFVGQSVERAEDRPLLLGTGRFADDLPVRPGTLHAAVLRSPHAHAEIRSVDCSQALAMDGVAAVVTGEDARKWSRPFLSVLRGQMEHWCVAVDRVRHVGEPVAVVAASDRYVAEDAAERIAVDYRPLAAVTDPEEAAADGSPALHPGLGGNVVSARSFSYGEPRRAFAAAEHRVAVRVDYPRNAGMPIECSVVLAEHEPGEGAYDVLANFQGPFTLHSVMAGALRVPDSRLRMRTPPDSGGSFGAKQGMFPMVVAMCLAARKAGRPVKWVEDRAEHLMAATSSTNRVARVEAGVSREGEVVALSYDQLEDCGAYLRAPEPATLYRMHGNMTGAYKVRNLEITNRVVLTNKTPTGLVRGFGGPQVYFGLERLMWKVAHVLGLDPVEVTRRNLVPPEAFPYRTPSGALLDSGDYPAAVEQALSKGGMRELSRRRDEARKQGRIYGIGHAAVVEPSISNMGYVSTALPAEEREKSGPKGGAQSVATVGVDPLGSVRAQVASTPQGQGHRTVVAQAVADVLGLRPEDVAVNAELDTGKDAWSISSGNYSSRFAGAVAGAAHLAATRLRERLSGLAALRLEVDPSDVEFSGGMVHAKGDPEGGVPFRRIAGTSHWAQGTLPEGAEPAIRETVYWSPPGLDAPTARDEINSSATHGFVFDFCGAEVDPDTGKVRIDRYVTFHDAGRVLHPAMLDGQVRGGFAHGIGAALLEHLSYGADGSFLSGTLADYCVPTACETPDPVILHMETPSPLTPLGAKGAGEGNSMSTPVCIANAVADALGAEDVRLPLVPWRVMEMVHPDERPASANPRAQGAASADVPARGIVGEGTSTVAADPRAIWAMLLDPASLAALVPGCQELTVDGEHSYRIGMTLGVGPVRGSFSARVRLTDLDPPRSLRLEGEAQGPLGFSEGEGRVTLEEADGGTLVTYRYSVNVGGKVAAVGGRMLDGATRLLIAQFFDRISARAAGETSPDASWWLRLLRWLGLGR